MYGLPALGGSGRRGDRSLLGDAAVSAPRPTGGISRIEMVVSTRLGAAAEDIKGGPIEGLQWLCRALSA